MRFLENAPETHARFERVSALIEGFESSFGLELLSTVHWIASEEKILVFDDIVNHTLTLGTKERNSFRGVRLRSHLIFCQRRAGLSIPMCVGQRIREGHLTKNK